MNEHDRVIGIVRAKNQSPIDLNPRHAALVVVDMQRFFTQPSFPFTQVFEKLSPGAAAGYLKRVRETVIPSIQKLLTCFRSAGSPIVFTALAQRPEMGVNSLVGFVPSTSSASRRSESGPGAIATAPCAGGFMGLPMERKVSAKNFRWLSGRELLKVYESSPGKTRAFCAVCGSSLGVSAGDKLNEVTLGSFDTDPGVRPIVSR